MDVVRRKQSDRIIQAVRYHGHLLANNILEEHQHNPHMTFLDASQLLQSANSSYSHVQNDYCTRESDSHNSLQAGARKVESFHGRLCKFISTKADLIFAVEGKEQLRKGVDYGSLENSEAYETFANTPPLEKFLAVDASLKKRELFMTLQPGDIVTGRVVYKRPFGVIVKLLKMERISRDFSDLEVLALCRTTEMPNSREFPDPNDAYTIDDIVKGVVISTDPNQQQVFISFRTFQLLPQFSHIQLGVVEEGEQSVSAREWEYTEGRTYNEHLDAEAGFSNPRNVDTLMEILGVNANRPCSLLRGAQRSFSEGEYYEEIRRKQSSKWSLETTAKGVELFKVGNTGNAIKCFNHALEIDPSNVEALVARGALNANQDRLSAAVQDFHDALSINPHHKNANKYLAETLVAQGKMFEEENHLQKALDCYKEITERDSNSEAGRIAMEKLQNIKAQMAEKEKLAEYKRKNPEGVNRGASTSSDKGQFNHVRQLIRKDKHFTKKLKKKERKMKRQKSKSKHKKKERKRKRSSSESSSSSDSKSDSEKEKDSPWVEKPSVDQEIVGVKQAPHAQSVSESFDQTVGISQVLFWYENTQRNAPKKVVRGPLNKQDSKSSENGKDVKVKGKTAVCDPKSMDKGRNAQSRKRKIEAKHREKESSSSETSSSNGSRSGKHSKHNKNTEDSHSRHDSSSDSDTTSSSSDSSRDIRSNHKRKNSSSRDSRRSNYGRKQNKKSENSKRVSSPDTEYSDSEKGLKKHRRHSSSKDKTRKSYKN